jgi:1-acyl-sn-glycerol-3-phosphate acyltransferase
LKIVVTAAGASALLRSLLFTSILFVSVPFYCVPVMLCAAFPYRVRFAIVRNWGRMVMASLRLLCGLRYVVEGREHMPAQPCVVLLKHQSAWETIAEVLFIPDQSWVLKRELMWAPFLGWALAALRPIAIDRRAHRTALDQVVEQGKERLAAGLWVMVFPEGTRVAPGTQARYGLGGAALAKAANVPIVPVAHNAGWYWRRRAWIKYPGTIRVRVGPAIAPADLTVPELTEAARNWIEGAVTELDAAARAEVGALGDEAAPRGKKTR